MPILRKLLDLASAPFKQHNPRTKLRPALAKPKIASHHYMFYVVQHKRFHVGLVRPVSAPLPKPTRHIGQDKAEKIRWQGEGEGNNPLLRPKRRPGESELDLPDNSHAAVLANEPPKQWYKEWLLLPYLEVYSFTDKKLHEFDYRFHPINHTTDLVVDGKPAVQGTGSKTKVLHALADFQIKVEDSKQLYEILMNLRQQTRQPKLMVANVPSGGFTVELVRKLKGKFKWPTDLHYLNED